MFSFAFVVLLFRIFQDENKNKCKEINSRHRKAAVVSLIDSLIVAECCAKIDSIHSNHSCTGLNPSQQMINC